MNLTAQSVINKLQLQPHPEGGYFKETYRASKVIGERFLPENMKGQRHYSTAIYFLIETNSSSKFHKLSSDEIWHFHLGDAIEFFQVTPNRSIEKTIIGPNIAENQTPQHVIEANNWFAAKVLQDENSKHSFSLISCTVSPGFDFQDFQMASIEDLSDVRGINNLTDLIAK